MSKGSLRGVAVYRVRGWKVKDAPMAARRESGTGEAVERMNNEKEDCV